MAESTIQLDIVSLETTLFGGPVKHFIVRGELGELGIYPGHTPLLTSLKPGQIVVTLPDGSEDLFYVSGGMLEVQPHAVTVLADVAMHARDIDEAQAIKVEQDMRQALTNKQSELDYSRALSELAEASAQIRAISELKRKLTRARK